MRCYEIMQKQVQVVPPDLSVSETAQRMREQSLGFFPVCDSAGRVLGVVTDRDIALQICGERRSVDTPVEQIMSPQIIFCAPDDPLSVAEELLMRHAVHHVLLMDVDCRLEGVLSLSDIAQHEPPIRLARLVQKLAASSVRLNSSRPPAVHSSPPSSR